MKDFARQILNPASNLVGNEEAVKLCKVLIKSKEPISSRRMVDSWAEPACVVPVLILPLQIIHFVRNMYNNAAIYERCQHIALLRWPHKRRGGLYSMNIKTWSVLDHSAQGLLVTNFVLPPVDSGLGFFTARALENER